MLNIYNQGIMPSIYFAKKFAITCIQDKLHKLFIKRIITYVRLFIQKSTNLL